MSQIIAIWSRVRASLEKSTFLAALLTRVTIAQVFIESGWGKLHGIPKVTGYFTELGIPAPDFMAHLVAWTEFGCGTLILLGLFTRLAAIPLITTMIVAILTAKKEDLHSFSDLTGFIEYLYIVLLIWLILEGAGFLSLDRWLAKRFKKKGA